MTAEDSEREETASVSATIVLMTAGLTASRARFPPVSIVPLRLFQRIEQTVPIDFKLCRHSLT